MVKSHPDAIFPFASDSCGDFLVYNSSRARRRFWFINLLLVWCLASFLSGFRPAHNNALNHCQSSSHHRGIQWFICQSFFIFNLFGVAAFTARAVASFSRLITLNYDVIFHIPRSVPYLICFTVTLVLLPLLLAYNTQITVIKYLVLKTKKILLLECDIHANKEVNGIKSKHGQDLLPSH